MSHRRRKRRSRRHTPTLRYLSTWQMLGVGLFAAIGAGSLAPISINAPAIEIPNFDKVVHFVAYGLLTAWYLAVFPVRRRWLIPVLLLGFGVLIEWLQGLTGYRDASVADAAADLGGIVIAAWLLVRPMRQAMVAIEAIATGHSAAPDRQRKQQLRHLALWQILGAHFAVGVLLTAFMPIEVDRLPVTQADKIIHFLVWGTLTAWFLLAFPGRKRGVLIPALMLALSIALEALQGLTWFGGDPSLLDVAADLVGIIIACVVVISPLKGLLLRIERRLFKPRRRGRRRRRRMPLPAGS